MMEYSNRPASKADTAFLVAAVLEAERAPGFPVECVYERLFETTRAQTTDLLTYALESDARAHQLDINSFHIIEFNEAPVACCSAWVEAHDGQPSGLKLAMLFSRWLGLRKWRERAAYISCFAACSPRRTEEALQLETFYVDPNHRRKVLTKRLIDSAVARHARDSSNIVRCEISLFMENTVALAAYERAGFKLTWRTTGDASCLIQIAGSKGFLQVSRELRVAGAV